MKSSLSLVLVLSVITGCAGSRSPIARHSSDVIGEQSFEVVSTSEVKWEQLNPARGDSSPKAGTLWGDRNGSAATGFLVQFVDGFSSPPHIHNVSYRGVVINGSIHNDDPSAGEMWMPKSSYWTQPKGAAHITAAKGSVNMAYIEIEEGPYLVLPIEDAFDSGERPINVEKSNIIWLDASNTTWIDQHAAGASSNGPQIAFLWGKPQGDQLNGTLVKLPARFKGAIRSHGSSFRAVVIQGQVGHQVPSATEHKTLTPGSYFSAKGESVHQVACEGGEECIVYVRMDGTFDVIPN